MTTQLAPDIVCWLSREAGTSILSFLIRLVEPSLLQSSTGSVSAVLQSAFVPRAAGLVRLLLAGVTGALPDWRCKEIGELIYSMLAVRGACTGIMACYVLIRHPRLAHLHMVQTMRQQAYEWVAGAISALPDVSATQADREKACRAMAAAAAGESAGSAANSASLMRCNFALHSVVNSSSWLL